MNKLKYLLSAAAVLCCFTSCKDDPWEDVADGGWNHERTIIDIKFEGQIGTPVITNLDETTGEIELKLAEALVEDLSAVRIEALTLSYNARGSVKAGDTLDFTQEESPAIVITSASGESRSYSLITDKFRETLVGSYAISGSWVYGGTGPSYGGTALMMPEKKSWCWNTKGFGPAAEYDDYLEFTLTEIRADGNTCGTCVHYGGVDAKHWDCMFVGKNKAGRQLEEDLSRFYRQIPAGTSTWERNYATNTLTFIDADGRRTSGMFIETPGSYDVGDGKAVEVADHAFRFTLRGSEDWDEIYGDYDKFGRNPQAYFVLATKVDAIPEASKTEGEVREPVDPGMFSLEGTYKVQRLTVYGGTADPAFVDPPEKSAWGEGRKNDMDNLLVMTRTGEDGKGSEKGEADFQPGADGVYWDYIFPASANRDGTGDLDMTKYYGKLPHGISSYTYNPETGECAFFRLSPLAMVSAKVLGPGDYTYGSKTLTVPAGTIALDFSLPGETSKGKYPWTDYDRFVIGPYNYVMIFEKQ